MITPKELTGKKKQAFDLLSMPDSGVQITKKLARGIHCFEARNRTDGSNLEVVIFDDEESMHVERFNIDGALEWSFSMDTDVPWPIIETALNAGISEFLKP